MSEWFKEHQTTMKLIGIKRRGDDAVKTLELQLLKSRGLDKSSYEITSGIIKQLVKWSTNKDPQILAAIRSSVNILDMDTETRKVLDRILVEMQDKEKTSDRTNALILNMIELLVGYGRKLSKSEKFDPQTHRERAQATQFVSMLDMERFYAEHNEADDAVLEEALRRNPTFEQRIAVEEVIEPNKQKTSPNSFDEFRGFPRPTVGAEPIQIHRDVDFTLREHRRYVDQTKNSDKNGKED